MATDGTSKWSGYELIGHTKQISYVIGGVRGTIPINGLVKGFWPLFSVDLRLTRCGHSVEG